jgi:hypothetical protein
MGISNAEVERDKAGDVAGWRKVDKKRERVRMNSCRRQRGREGGKERERVESCEAPSSRKKQISGSGK